MGSYPRRENAERKTCGCVDTVPALDCQVCGALTPGERVCYYRNQIICEVCNEWNPPTRRRLVLRFFLQPREICVNFILRRDYSVQAMDLDCRTMLDIERQETLRRLLTCLGDTRAARRIRPVSAELGPGLPRLQAASPQCGECQNWLGAGRRLNGVSPSRPNALYQQK